jgi:hypothetical protein
MRRFKLITLIIMGLIAMILNGVTLVSAETFVEPKQSMKTDLTGKDSDEDGIDDETELRLARRYSPLLVFDENEQEDVQVTVLPLFQVSPIIHHSGQEGAMLTFVFLYDNDNGADFDRDWTDWFTDPLDTAGGLIMDPFDQFFGKHCGDTEVIYFFIANYGNWTNTRLESIYWKRHYDKIYETSQSAVRYKDLNDGTGATHPIIYVSEDKHGMYPNHDECEDYETDVVKEALYDKYIPIPVTPKMEDCSGGKQLFYTYNMYSTQNVGEAKSENTKNRAALNGTLYDGYDPWANVEFWGRTDYDKLCETPAGGIGGKWCGTPFSVGSDHPCSSNDWWEHESSGYCMNLNTDRFGSDYASFFMDGYDATPCAEACINDSNCLSFSYVLPGYQYDNSGVCYLKNGIPDEYYNECCISGIKEDCVN